MVAYVYILASQRNGTLYVGVTSNLGQRLYQHQQELLEGFTKRYAIHQLVYVEAHENILTAIQREKALKFWKRSWKLRLIEEANPGWEDLSNQYLSAS